LGYTGRELDPETGMYYYRARYYDPEIGRFLGEDPLGFEAGVNFYTYVSNNPINFNDPMGMEPPQNIPPDVDVLKNINTASDMNSLKFFWNVRQHGEWDYKNQIKKYGPDARKLYENFGNYHYGLAGAANGWEAWNLLRTAGFVQIVSGTSKAEFGSPADKTVMGPYGDDPKDQYWIYQGIKDYYSGYWGNKADHSQSNILNFPLDLMYNNTLNSTYKALRNLFSKSSSSSNASGGFVIYPNKPNTNMMQSVYSK
jgi:RHS repeat-associated protein